MIWQDIAIVTANLLFSYSLIFQVYHGFKRKKGFIHFKTAILTTLAGYLLTISFLSIGLIFSAIVNLFSSSLWGVLTLQRIVYEKA